MSQETLKTMFTQKKKKNFFVGEGWGKQSVMGDVEMANTNCISVL